METLPRNELNNVYRGSVNVSDKGMPECSTLEVGSPVILKIQAIVTGVNKALDGYTASFDVESAIVVGPKAMY